MSLDLNRVFFGGRLTSDPQPLGDNGQGCRFDVACNRSYKDRNGEKKEDTTFMPVTCWDPLAKLVMQRCFKGSSVIVEGRIEVRKFSADDGTTKKFVNIVASDVRFEQARDAQEQPLPKEEDSIPAGVDKKSVALLQHILGNK